MISYDVHKSADELIPTAKPSGWHKDQITLSYPDDIRQYRKSSGWHTALSISYQDEIGPWVNSSRWLGVQLLLSHSNDLGKLRMSSELKRKLTIRHPDEMLSCDHQEAVVPNSHHGLLRKSHFFTFYWTSYILRRCKIMDIYVCVCVCAWTLCMMWILCWTGYFARYLNIKFDVFVPPVHGLFRNGVISWHWTLSWNFHYWCFPLGTLLMSLWKDRLRARSTSASSDMAMEKVEESFSASFLLHLRPLTMMKSLKSSIPSCLLC